MSLQPNRVMAAILTAVVTLPSVVRAQSIPAECHALIAAEQKEIGTPHHVYSTEVSGKTTRTSESISAGGVNYLNYKGKWMRSPLTPAALLSQLERNLSTAKAMSCKMAGSETIGGISATVYQVHTENEGVTADGRTWVASASGLVLRQEEDVDTGGGDKRHRSQRYEYGNVQAPAGVP